MLGQGVMSGQTRGQVSRMRVGGEAELAGAVEGGNSVGGEGECAVNGNDAMAMVSKMNIIKQTIVLEHRCRKFKKMNYGKEQERKEEVEWNEFFLLERLKLTEVS